MTDLQVIVVPQRDRRLGRQLVHDERSRGFAATNPIDTSTWRTRSLRIYDPLPNPDQPVGNCTCCAKAMEFNTVGNRRRGVVLGMDWALERYRRATRLDPFDGAWEPDDTGSSGLGACKAAQESGDGGEYAFDFRGADGVVQGVVDGRPQNIGTWWYGNMFDPDSRGRIEPTGYLAGGHQYVARGYDETHDEVIIRCWWGAGYRDVRIRRAHLNELILDGGDVHTQARLSATG